MTVILKQYRPRPVHLHVSPGVSESASLVQDIVQNLALDMAHWLEASRHIAGDAEQDVVVLLPPKRQFVANVQIIARRRPDLVIAAEDFPAGTVDPGLVICSEASPASFSTQMGT